MREIKKEVYSVRMSAVSLKNLMHLLIHSSRCLDTMCGSEF